VPCIESRILLALAVVAVLAGCGRSSTTAPADARPTAAPVGRSSPSVDSAAAPEPAAPGAAAGRGAEKREQTQLPEPRAMRNWAEVRQQAAERLVAANPHGTYMGEVPETLLAIPVLEIELNGDGSVRRIVVLRSPRQAKDTIKIATEAIHRAAPFGNVSRLPRPWKFVETFLFDDARRFKPRTLNL
jgi:hypothetical protein